MPQRSPHSACQQLHRLQRALLAVFSILACLCALSCRVNRRLLESPSCCRSCRRPRPAPPPHLHGSSLPERESKRRETRLAGGRGGRVSAEWHGNCTVVAVQLAAHILVCALECLPVSACLDSRLDGSRAAARRAGAQRAWRAVSARLRGRGGGKGGERTQRRRSGNKEEVWESRQGHTNTYTHGGNGWHTL